MLMCD